VCVIADVRPHARSLVSPNGKERAKEIERKKRKRWKKKRVRLLEVVLT